MSNAVFKYSNNLMIMGERKYVFKRSLQMTKYIDNTSTIIEIT